jgi:predicted MFS family arabinose efflux permease
MPSPQSAGAELFQGRIHHLLYACLLAAGTAKAFWMPARAAFLPRIVPMDIFSNAVSWNTSGFEIATMTGPALGGC